MVETVGVWIVSIFTLGVGYLAFFVTNLILYRRGKTVGAHLFHIRVVRDTGDLAGFYQMSVRSAASIISAIPLGLGFWWAFWDAEKRTWHDKMLGTYVMRDTPELNARPGTSSDAAKIWFWLLLVGFVVLGVLPLLVGV
ncbi:MAG: RDD family protein [Chloroflexi bacterium]|nr:RDD family protein [Chloroflexota bacterium]